LIDNGCEMYSRFLKIDVLYIAVYENNIYLTKRFVKYMGFYVDHVYPGNVTCLILSVKNENYGITEFLLENGANVDQSDGNNTNVLGYAIKTKSKGLISLILGYKPMLHTSTFSALKMGFESKSEEIVKMISDVSGLKYDNPCPICLDDDHMIKLSCGHMVHFDCQSEYIKSNNSCVCSLCMLKM
jgi:hypothetical protein